MNLSAKDLDQNIFTPRLRCIMLNTLNCIFQLSFTYSVLYGYVQQDLSSYLYITQHIVDKGVEYMHYIKFIYKTYFD